MSRHTARARSGQDRTGLYQEITDKIIAELEAGRAPGSPAAYPIGGRPRALGPALGDGGGESAARHAQERRDP